MQYEINEKAKFINNQFFLFYYAVNILKKKNDEEMKISLTRVFLAIVLLVSFINSNAINDDSVNVYKIIDVKKSNKKVNSSNKAYIILIQDLRNKDFFTVVSIKKKCDYGKKIKVGKSYVFELNKCFENDLIINIGLNLSVEIQGVSVQIPMNNFTSNIYTTSSLKGLYFCEEQISN